MIAPRNLAVGSGNDEIGNVCAVEQDLVAAGHYPAVALAVLESVTGSLVKSRMSRSAEVYDVVADPLIDVLGILCIVLALLDPLEDLVCCFVHIFALYISCRRLPYLELYLGFGDIAGTVSGLVVDLVLSGLVGVELGCVNVENRLRIVIVGHGNSVSEIDVVA